MGFAAQWASAMADIQAPMSMDKMDNMDTIQVGGNSVHSVHIVHRVSTPTPPAWNPIRNIRTIRTIHDPGNSANTANYANRGSTPATPPPPTGPAPEGTGLEWIVKPTDPDAPGYGSQWAAFDLADFGRLYGVRVVRAGERVLAVYPPALEPELIAYASELLAEARDFLRQHMDRLPVLTPAEAVKAILEIMRRHDGLRFTRGDDGSRWPLYPSTWTTGQRVTLQALWFAAGDALDRDDFIMEETEL